MSAVYDYLTECKAQLQSVAGLDTVAIGLERGIGAKDTPFARLVPVMHAPEKMTTLLRFQVVYGFDIKNRDYEQLHRHYFEMERDLIDAIGRTGASWERTVTDEDTVPNLKTAIIFFTKKGIQC